MNVVASLSWQIAFFACLLGIAYFQPQIPTTTTESEQQQAPQHTNSNTQQQTAEMYDFCFSPIYAVLLAIGGVAGYLTKGSMASLGAGLGSAALLGLMSKWSLDSYHKGKACKSATAISLLVAAGLTYVMYERYSATGKLMPAGLTAGLSAAMTVFYVWSLLLGPTPKPKAA